MVEIVTRVGEVYARAPSHGLSEEQAHWLASLLACAPGTELQLDGALVTIVRPGTVAAVLAVPTVPAWMPFEGAGAPCTDGG